MLHLMLECGTTKIFAKIWVKDLLRTLEGWFSEGRGEETDHILLKSSIHCRIFYYYALG